MKQLELAKWIKAIIIISAIIGLIICFIIVPVLGKDLLTIHPEFDYMFIPSLIFIWITAIPFYIALWLSWSIAGEISKDRSFSKKNADSLKKISYLAVSESMLYFLAIVALLILKLLHPGILIIALFIIFIGIALAVTTAALSRLVEKARLIEEENELTI